MVSENNTNSVYSGFSIEHPPCPITRRVIAYGIDIGIVSGITYALIIPGFLIYGALSFIIVSLGISESMVRILMVLSAILIVLIFLSIGSYYFISRELKHGATFGKKLLGLCVISLDGRKLDFRQCLYRDLMRLVDVTLILPGLISMILNKQNRRLGDIASGTMVVYIERKAKELDYFYIKQSEYELFLDKLSPSIPEDSVICEYLTFSLANYIHNKKDRKKAYEWDLKVRKYYKSDFANKIDRDTALLFFAEYCHQLKLKESTKKYNNFNNHNIETHNGSSNF